jgi:hypothetical protein
MGKGVAGKGWRAVLWTQLGNWGIKAIIIGKLGFLQLGIAIEELGGIL